MAGKTDLIIRFLNSARNLANQGLSKEAIMQFAKNEFGEISELFQKQIDNIFKPKKGIENIKIKDEVFDDTVIKLPVDDTGVPFNPNDPLKQYGKPKKSRMLNEDEYQDFLDEVGGADQLEAYDFDGTVGSAKKILKEQKEYMDDMFMEYKKGNLDPVAGDKSPARKRFLQNKLDEMEMSGDTKLMTRDEIEELNSFDLGTDMDEAIKKFKEKDAKQKKTLKDFDPEDRDPSAEGGIAGFYTGGMVDVEPNLSDIGHGSDALMARTRLVAPNSQATTSTGLNYLLAEDNDNIRVPFSKGKIAKEIVDKGRRGFIKAAGAAGAGIAALKTGLIGLGEKAAPVVEKAVESAKGVPPYFYQLVDVIKSKGQEIKSYGERIKQYIAPSKDGKSELMLTEDLNTGDIQVKKIYKENDDMVTKTEEMNFNKGQADEGTKGTPPDDYEEVTSYNSRIYKDEFNEPDFVEGIDVEEIVKEVDVKKADGGRIGYAKGKLVFENAAKFLEKIFGKKNMAEMPKRDPEMYQGMLEVVDMFRNKDTEGLIKYMQKFLPHMGKKEVQAFIKGDAEDAAGLGKFGLDNLQGQLIRLGSGRDYKSKIEAIKKLEDAKKLDTLEVTEEMIRKPNASGGIARMIGE